jgi:hypothetical protein
VGRGRVADAREAAAETEEALADLGGTLAEAWRVAALDMAEQRAR